MADEYIRKQDVVDVINTNADDLEQNGGIPFAQGARAMAIVVEQMPPADVVSVSVYKQVMWERDVAVEQLKQIGKDVREVTDDVAHLQRLLSADIVKIVRCKNCKYRSYDEVFCCYWCEHEGMAREVKHDFYCGYGEE